ncbi:helix-turn-helix domain-containing protein [Pedobacter metabolipauper]|uniref:Helix-turn-helix protein n=1 Tax=Pedobacter metabolipauper TaxID=425513 RepID=A0A4R6SUV3_9SPHI|nr:helix-turn-helix domain-containing protein [Pedobacter metabolipauper]TDQ08219.1 helix-turn-helix protein [Pedobacter metabolipauper]
MSYTEIKPHHALALYIDAYWISEYTHGKLYKTKILPDGCVDIILNLKDDYKTNDGILLMKSETAYLTGAMTTFKVHIIRAEAKLLGIRFKPAALSYFFKFQSLHEFTDQNIELEKGMYPNIHEINSLTIAQLNQFFLSKLSKPKHSLLPVIDYIHQNKGCVNVADLAKKHFTTTRQLERHFQSHVGLSPKEFTNLVRYQFTYKKIRNNISNRSLLQIAYESGYYDHAHLTNEIRKFTGVNPSQL